MPGLTCFLSRVYVHVPQMSLACPFFVPFLTLSIEGQKETENTTAIFQAKTARNARFPRVFRAVSFPDRKQQACFVRWQETARKQPRIRFQGFVMGLSTQTTKSDKNRILRIISCKILRDKL